MDLAASSYFNSSRLQALVSVQLFHGWFCQQRHAGGEALTCQPWHP